MERDTRDWSPQQRAIFDWFKGGEGNLVVRARAGTGKTTTIIEAIEHAPEAKVLLAAFNKEISTELAKRCTRKGADVKTLHALGFAFVRRHWPKVRVDSKRKWTLADAVTPRTAPRGVATLVGNLHTKVREVYPHVTRVSEVLDVAAAFNLVASEELELAGWGDERIASLALRAVELAKEQPADGVIDFADMIFLPCVHGWAERWYDLVVVDEAQDMSAPQLELALGSVRHGGRVAVVGDDRQAIYGFRGADSGSIDRLKGELQAQELGLTVTYRCPQKVVRLAATLVPDFTAHESAPEGEIHEGKRVADVLQNAKPGDFVLSRKNAPLAALCLALLARGVRAHVRGRDMGAGIRALLKATKVTTIEALPAALARWLERETARAAKLDEDAADDRIAFCQDQAEVVRVLANGCDSLEALDARCASLFSDNDLHNAVTLSTVHKAKGLEAPTVWVLKDTFFSRRDGEDNSEENNIRYVAWTRAKAVLIFVVGEDVRDATGGDL